MTPFANAKRTPDAIYVVHNGRGVETFQTLQFAKKYAHQEAPATIWWSTDITYIHGDNGISTRADAKPVYEAWSK